MNNARIMKDMLIRWGPQFVGESCPERAFSNTYSAMPALTGIMLKKINIHCDLWYA